MNLVVSKRKEKGNRTISLSVLYLSHSLCHWENNRSDGEQLPLKSWGRPASWRTGPEGTRRRRARSTTRGGDRCRGGRNMHRACGRGGEKGGSGRGRLGLDRSWPGWTGWRLGRHWRPAAGRWAVVAHPGAQGRGDTSARDRQRGERGSHAGTGGGRR